MSWLSWQRIGTVAQKSRKRGLRYLCRRNWPRSLSKSNKEALALSMMSSVPAAGLGVWPDESDAESVLRLPAWLLGYRRGGRQPDECSAVLGKMERTWDSRTGPRFSSRNSG